MAASPPPYVAAPLLLLLLCLLAHPGSSSRPLPRLLALVPSSPLLLSYHDGPLLTRPINVYLLWYGSFSPSQQAIVVDFLSSFHKAATTTTTTKEVASFPSVASWWNTTAAYTDSSNAGVSGSLQLAGQSSDASYSKGKNLKKTDIGILVEHALATGLLPSSSDALYLVLTADDVLVEDFCMNSCGFHDSTSASPATKHQKMPYVWVGNAAQQCPGQCAWPYALPQFGPQASPLLSPNRDVGIDGMVINIATLLAGTATNPFNTGYFQGDSDVPLEAVSACTGIFGKGSYPGFPGQLLVDKTSAASYNARGHNDRMFLLPAMWNPSMLSCATLP